MFLLLAGHRDILGSLEKTAKTMQSPHSATSETRYAAASFQQLLENPKECFSFAVGQCRPFAVIAIGRTTELAEVIPKIRLLGVTVIALTTSWNHPRDAEFLHIAGAIIVQLCEGNTIRGDIKRAISELCELMGVASLIQTI